METFGRFIFIFGLSMWVTMIIVHWFVDDKINAIYVLCEAIGIMLLGNRLIDDARHKSDKG